MEENSHIDVMKDDSKQWFCDWRGNEDVFYGIGDQEDLDISLHGCVSSYLDACSFDDLKEGSEWHLTVMHYRRRKPTYPSSEDLVYDIMEYLDMEYGDPDGECVSDVTDEMIEAARKFVDTVLEGYTSWACEPNGEWTTVDVRDWILKHSPGWMDDDASIRKWVES